MNEAMSAIGILTIGISAERKWNRNRMITTLTMIASAIRSRLRVSMDALIRPERS
jgi:hypothetical protein